jgi:lipid A 4'-phosphatase
LRLNKKTVLNNRGIFNVIVVLGALFALNTLIRSFNLDMRIQLFFYDADKGWYIGETPLFKTLFLYGEKPAWILFSVSLALLVTGFIIDKWILAKSIHRTSIMYSFITTVRKYRKGFLLIVLLMIIGPGLIVNAVLKDHLGRPRPREVVEFGGEYEFVEPWMPGEAGKNSSFPSGHSSVAFYLFAPFFVLEKDKKLLRRCFLYLGISFGFLMGLARMAQGGHFLSDIIWSGVLVFLTAFFLKYFLSRQ